MAVRGFLAGETTHTGSSEEEQGQGLLKQGMPDDGTTPIGAGVVSLLYLNPISLRGRVQAQLVVYSKSWLSTFDYYF
ncbi:hypothetical protein V6N12_012307 [Hibiscus sabdariffa]|uniref:Uncharacterized protein n=1 Tax=Hibiscus sabdariffa TaxID=183260 RepID=A0ABR2CHQ3_9ROSI